MKFWKQKAKQRLKSHGKEFSAQEALLAKLVAAPGEYKRQDGFDLQEILAEEDKIADKEHEKNADEIGDEISDIGSNDDESSILTGEKNESEGKVDDESDDSGDKMTEEHIAHLLDNDA